MTRPHDAHTTHTRRPSDPTPPTSPNRTQTQIQTRPESLTSPPPLDPFKLNLTPASIPEPHAIQIPNPTSPTLRSAQHESSYFENETDTPFEIPSHPTVAETGDLGRRSSQTGPGPMSGQLKRVEGGERKDGKGIIKLGSFGGEGLMAKPPTGSLGSPKEGESRDGSAIAD